MKLFFLVSLFIFSGCFSKTKVITLKNSSLKVKVLKTQSEQEKGLMFKKDWGDLEGLLFVLDVPRRQRIWMKNTWLDISVGFFDEKGELQEIYKLKGTDPKKPESFLFVTPKTKSKYILEVPMGWFFENHIFVGDSLRI